MNIQRIKKVNGTGFYDISLIIESDEFDSVMLALDCSAELNRKDFPSYTEKVEKVKNAILKYGFFDKDKEEVRVRLGMKEFEIIMEVITFWIGVSEEDMKQQLPYISTTFKSICP